MDDVLSFPDKATYRNTAILMRDQHARNAAKFVDIKVQGVIKDISKKVKTAQGTKTLLQVIYSLAVDVPADEETPPPTKTHSQSTDTPEGEDEDSGDSEDESTTLTQQRPKTNRRRLFEYIFPHQDGSSYILRAPEPLKDQASNIGQGLVAYTKHNF